MENVYERCCGIDVHKKIIVACLMKGKEKEIKQFGATSQELRDLCKWLLESNCQMTAMESTASYWKPLYNILELTGLEAMVVNAHHMKSVPGRKTDVKDAEWIADLLQHGLLKASYIPDREQRELREVSRYRKSLIEERAREINRLQKMLEGANIKLGNYVRDINGKSSRRLLDSIIEDQQPTDEEVADMIAPCMRKNLDLIMQSLDGIMTSVQRQLIKSVIDHIDDMTRRIGDMDNLIRNQMKEYETAVESLMEIPGVGRTGAESILAEIGIDMSRFPTAAHLSSWAGLSPGNNESAGKKKDGHITKGNNKLKTTLIQCAKAARRCKTSYFSAQYERLAIRRGKNKATVAIAHSMLIAIYNMLKEHVPYKDLGADYYNQFDKEKKVKTYLKKLALLGCVIPEASMA